MDDSTLNQIADKRSKLEADNRSSLVNAQMTLLKSCLDVGVPINRLMPVIETWLMDNLEKR